MRKTLWSREANSAKRPPRFRRLTSGLLAKRDLGWVIESLRPCCDYAGERGVFLALENHGYLTGTSEEVFAILDGVNHEWLGVNMDTGNFVVDPYKNIKIVAPKAITRRIPGSCRCTCNAVARADDTTRSADTGQPMDVSRVT